MEIFIKLLLVLCAFVANTDAANLTTFILQPKLENKSCKDSIDFLAENIQNHRTCAHLCNMHASCESFFYNNVSEKCYGCKETFFLVDGTQGTDVGARYFVQSLAVMSEQISQTPSQTPLQRTPQTTLGTTSQNVEEIGQDLGYFIYIGCYSTLCTNGTCTSCAPVPCKYDHSVRILATMYLEQCRRHCEKHDKTFALQDEGGCLCNPDYESTSDICVDTGDKHRPFTGLESMTTQAIYRAK